MEARFETITGKKLNIEEKIDVVLSWSSKEAPPVIKGSLDANEDIGVVEVSSTIDDVFDIGKSNVESMEVRSEFSEFLELNRVIPALKDGEDELNRVIPTLKDRCGEFDGHLDEINLNLSEKISGERVVGGRGKKVLVAVAKGRRTTGVEDGTAGANASVNEGERSGDLEDTNISSEGDEVHIDPQEVSLQINEGVKTIRRSYRPSIFLMNFNDFIVDSKVKYGLEKYVKYSNLSKENLCFATVLNKGIEPMNLFRLLKENMLLI
ncbi:hypothetical protein Tco_1177815 [Tanacetum coccineum]